jgi:Raf kinase inhibitor-like YbhB/YbcL family protein
VHKQLSIGLFVVALAACGDDGAGDTTDTAADSGTAGTTSPTTTASMDSTGPSATTEPGSTSGEPGTGSTSEATSDSTGADSTGEMATTGGVEFTLTSPSFAEGETIPGVHHASGGNVSPQLDWVGVPAEAQSLAVFFHDLSIDNPHSGIWNIDPSATGLPEGREAVANPPSVPGAVQCRNWFNEFGYGGMGSPSNEYEFTVYALDVPDLDGEIDQDTPRAAVRQAFIDHAIDTATLSGFSGGPNAR